MPSDDRRSQYPSWSGVGDKYEVLTGRKQSVTIPRLRVKFGKENDTRITKVFVRDEGKKFNFTV